MGISFQLCCSVPLSQSVYPELHWPSLWFIFHVCGVRAATSESIFLHRNSLSLSIFLWHIMYMSCQRFFPNLADIYVLICSLWAVPLGRTSGISSCALCLDVNTFGLTTWNYEWGVFIRCLRVGILV